jgi:hypothetical protein
MVGGAPIGTEEFIKGELKTKLQELKDLANKVSMLHQHPYIALRMLKLIPLKTQHILKTVPTALTRDFAEKLDEIIWTTFLSLATPSEFPDPEEASIHRTNRAKTITELL